MNLMRMLKNDFATHQNNDDWYDIVDDWPLIESSFLKQYGIRLRSIEDMPWNEFCSYLAGIMPNTPLGNIVQIRSEDNKDVLKNYTKEQKRIRTEWLNRKAKAMKSEEVNDVIESFKQMFKQLAEGGN